MGNLWETKINWFKIWLPMFDFCISLKIVFVFLWKVYFNFFANCVCICVSRTKLACSGRPLRGRGKEEPRRTWTCLPPVRDQRDFLFLMSRYFLLTKKKISSSGERSENISFFCQDIFSFFFLCLENISLSTKKVSNRFLIFVKRYFLSKKNTSQELQTLLIVR